MLRRLFLRASFSLQQWASWLVRRWIRYCAYSGVVRRIPVLCRSFARVWREEYRCMGDGCGEGRLGVDFRRVGV